MNQGDNMISETTHNNKNLFFLLVSCFFVFLFPSSINGTIIDNMFIIRNTLAGVIVFVAVRKWGISKKPFFWLVILIAWLTLLTITTSLLCVPNDFRIAFASISAFLPVSIAWCITCDRAHLDYNTIRKILMVISCGLIVWGWGLVFRIPIIYNFTRNWYSQLTETMFDNMITLRGKPVMSFGTHSMAAYFIMYVFFYHCIVIKEQNGKIDNYICLLLLFMLEVPLNTTTSILSMAVMICLFIWAKNNHATRMIVLTAILGIIGYYYYTGELQSFVNGILNNPNAQKHGFYARYSTSNYAGNIRMILDYCGVGFLRSDSEMFCMKDSGFIYILTQGNVPAFIISYSLLFGFFKRNVVKYSHLCFFLFMIWELISASTFTNVKMGFAHILTMYIINSICLANNKSEERSYDCRESGQRRKELQV